jgi:hypothetical protein
MRTKLRSKVTLLFMTCALLIAVPAVAAIADSIDADIVGVSSNNSGPYKAGSATPVSVDYWISASGSNGCDATGGAGMSFTLKATHVATNQDVSEKVLAKVSADPVAVAKKLNDASNPTNRFSLAFNQCGDIDTNNKTVAFTSTKDLPAGQIRIDVDTITDAASPSQYTGNDHWFLNATDGLGPTVTTVVPQEDATDVDVAADVTATFSEAMDETTLIDADGDGNFTLKKTSDNSLVGADVSYNATDKKATLNPDADLAYSTSYTATVTTGAKDAAGNALDQEPTTDGDQAKTWTFTTEPPPNSAPVVDDISGDNSADEGQTKSYSVSASDPDGDALSYAWSITSGDSFAHIDGAANTSSASLVFDDGPGSVGLQVVVNDGNDHPVTKNLTISVNNVAPTTTLSAANPTSVNESSTTEHTYSYTISDPGTDTVSSVSTSCDTPNGQKVANSDSNTNTSGSFKCKFDDGSSTKQSTVSAQATDSDNDPGNTATQTVNIANVAPTVTNVSALVQNVLSGNNVSFTGTATDPSNADTTAGFFWQFSKDGGLTYTPSSLPTTFASNSNQFTTKFDSCGAQSVKAKATDKDGDTSAAVSSGNVNVYTAPFKAPLVDGSVNTVQKGRVIPVKISVGCGTNLLTGLAPRIDLLSGDVSPESESGATAVTTSVSSADTGQTMREVDGGYIYNLQVPSTAGKYTIRVNPWGVQTSAAAWSASSNYIVLDVRSK